ncbi:MULTISPECIES: acetyl-CoA hydrolase/transferase family protein [Citricoccus]|uniref:Acetyl-CoA hydrolase/transferase family protein n=2 Tax=Citricoccus parietis TaxID=592307 RepID=A0ABV6F0K1_9MICC|nr:acetyl-CoA hydrolase/transferase C-terminal domain-containing protein [Citricoccus sp. K5]VXC22155.1 4-hydroxybutyrate coenzyme A transferase [Citricoccus sp. K5]
MNSDWITTHIHCGDLVVVAQGVGEPTGLLNQLLAADLPEVEIFVGLSHSDALTGSSPARPLISFGAMGPLRKLATVGQVQVIPCAFTDLTRVLPLRVKGNLVVVLQVGPADHDGNHSPGISLDYTYELLDRADVVVAEVNAAVPTTTAPTIPADSFDAVVHTRRPLPTVPPSAVAEEHQRIAHHAARLIPDGATIQLGIGSIPGILGKTLGTRRDLRVRSTLIGDWLLDLHTAGALSDEPDAVVLSEAAGSEDLYHLVSDSDFLLRPISEVVAPAAAGSIPKYFAINSALQVDLSGQVNAEETDSGYIGGIGGQTEFFRAAQRSPGGASIVVLPATAHGGSSSRIVSRLTPATVTTPRSGIDYIVTEFGVADLRGRTLPERAEAIAAVAAPQHRQQLLEQNGYDR